MQELAKITQSATVSIFGYDGANYSAIGSRSALLLISDSAIVLCYISVVQLLNRHSYIRRLLWQGTIIPKPCVKVQSNGAVLADC